MEKLPHWRITDKFPAVYDLESATAIEMTAKLYGAMNTLIDEYNKFVDNVNANIEAFENDTKEHFNEFAISLSQEFQTFINVIDLKIAGQDAKIDDAINYMKTNLNIAIASMLEEIKENGELTQEILDAFADIAKGYALHSEINRAYYVDSETGSDDNDGLTKSTPFKSFNRFLDEYAHYNEIRCHFIGNGDYYEQTKYETINACGMHIVNESNNANVTIKWIGKASPCFYNSHLNIAGSASKCITLDIPNGLYFDGGMYTMDYTVIVGAMTTTSGVGFSMNGGYGIHNYCTFNSCRLRGSGAVLTITHTTFNGDMTACVSVIQGSTLRIAGSFNCNANVGASGALYVMHSTLYLGCSPTLANNQKAMELAGAITFAKAENFNKWNVNGSKFTFSPLLSETYQFLNTQ